MGNGKIFVLTNGLRDEGVKGVVVELAPPCRFIGSGVGRPGGIVRRHFRLGLNELWADGATGGHADENRACHALHGR